MFVRATSSFPSRIGTRLPVLRSAGRAPKNLLSISLGAAPGYRNLKHAEIVISELARHQGETLESLMFYGYGDRHPNLRPQDSDLWCPEIFQAFKALRHLLLGMIHIQLGIRDCGKEQKVNESDIGFLRKSIIDCLPEGMETLAFWGEPLFGSDFWEFNDEVDLENAIIEIITLKQFKNLRAIFLKEVERARHETEFEEDGVHTERIWFQNAIKIGAEHSIDVDTITNRNEKLLVFNFPRALDKFDFETGLSGTRPTDWEFDTHHGKWTPPDCRKCGNCGECLTHYTKELWNSIANA